MLLGWRVAVTAVKSHPRGTKSDNNNNIHISINFFSSNVINLIFNKI